MDMMKKIPFSPPDITEEEIQEVAEALRSGWITTGPRTKEFEKQIAAFCGTDRAVCLNSATACLELTLRLLAIIRLMQPHVLLPATTALGTIDPRGREKGILAGANVVMPNLSPQDVRKKYMLYDNKICTGDEAAECVKCLSNRIASTGYELVCDRGDYK